MYKVLKYFTDLQDNDYEYEVNAIYPREGLNPTEKRIKELAGNQNRQRTPLIKKVAEPKQNKNTKSEN